MNTPASMYGILYLEINLISSFLVLIIRAKTLGLTRMEAQRMLSSAIDSQIILFLSDAFAVLIETGLLKLSAGWLIAAKTVYFLAASTVCYCWFLYFSHLMNSRFTQRRKGRLIASGLLLIIGILLLLNPFTGICFSVSPEGLYRRGPLFALLFAVPYVYVLSVCGRAFLEQRREESYSRRDTLKTIALFPLLPFLASAVQFVHPELPLLCAALSIETLILYLSWTESLISMDPLTRLNNRRHLEYQYDHWRKEAGSEGMFLLLVDADSFKAVNDTWGHGEGDRALCRIAEAMRRAAAGRSPHTCIARFGGDEFALLVRTNTRSEAEALARSIQDHLRILNEKEGSPFPLTVSIGIAAASKDDSLRALVKEADTSLYEAKKLVHSEKSTR